MAWCLWTRLTAAARSAWRLALGTIDNLVCVIEPEPQCSFSCHPSVISLHAASLFSSFSLFLSLAHTQFPRTLHWRVLFLSALSPVYPCPEDSHKLNHLHPPRCTACSKPPFSNLVWFLDIFSIQYGYNSAPGCMLSVGSTGWRERHVNEIDAFMVSHGWQGPI